MQNNLILLSDSYKYSHYSQYPTNTESIYSYMEARGGEYSDVIFFGLQYYIKEYLNKPITKANIEEAYALSQVHGIPFYKEGWDDLLNYRGGHLPLRIRAVPEGSINKVGDVLMTIENTDKRFFWLTNWTETLLMKVWYPTTVATKSYAVKQMLKSFWDKASDNSQGIDFAYHNFGDRGSTSVEAAMLGGMAHLTQFSGTDNFNAVKGCGDYYNTYFGYSIPASEHSTMTSWGRGNEFKAIENYLEVYKSSPIIACVLDSYDIYKATDFVTSGTMQEKIESDDYPVFVIRPDSGNPLEIIPKLLKILEDNLCSYYNNPKGYRVFNKYRIIWGDGITPETIKDILELVTSLGYAPDNFAFGSGGDLMQNVNRDTCKFAIKCSAARIDGSLIDVYKDPITDSGKKSKRGLVSNPKLETVFDGFPVSGYVGFEEVRQRSC